MAGRLRNCRYCRVLLGFLTLVLTSTVLIATRVWNPLPTVSSWWNRFTVLSVPEPAWTIRLGGVPDLAAVLTDGQAIVATRGFVEAYSSGGEKLWAYKVHWALPAHDVVVLRQRPENPDADPAPDRGYAVVEPQTGAVIWSDKDAIAVWVFADRILDLSCPDAGGCRLRARAHRDNGLVDWTVPLPAEARTILGAQPALAGTRDPAEWFATAASGTPGTLPSVIGLTVAGRIQVIDTFEGRRVREIASPNRETRIALSGERLLLSHAERVDSACRFWLEAFEYRSDKLTWRMDGVDLDTASGASCEQRRDPLGAGNRLVGLRADNHPNLISAVSGEPVWTGIPGERILATDGELAVIVAADQTTVRVLDLLDAQKRAVWTGAMGLKPQAAVTRDYIIIRNRDAGGITVLSRAGAMVVREVKSKAEVIGYGPRGLLIASGRRIGYLPL